MTNYIDEDFNESTDLDGQDDLVKQQEYQKGGRTFFIVSDGTFGLWHIKPKNGKVPEQLDGSFTTPLLAQNAVDQYMGSYVPVNPDRPESQSTRKVVLTPKPAPEKLASDEGRVKEPVKQD